MQTTFSEIDQSLSELRAAAPRLQQMSAAERARLARQCLLGVAAVADDWIDVSCATKGLDPRSPLAAEEIIAGPMATVRFLRLLADALHATQNQGRPTLPGSPYVGAGDQVIVPVFPTRGPMYDRLLFIGFRCAVWMRSGITLDSLAQHMAGEFRPSQREPCVCLVLGAGNVSSIAATDMLTKLLQEGRTVLLKMNPVNAYLGPLFARAFDVLLREGFLRLVYGGAEVGSYATQHDSVDAVHITGSTATHRAIVWGTDPDDRAHRMANQDPLLTKTITSELGNVTPWIIVPGQYSQRQLRAQAENLTASIVNNASFNCVATKMIVTSRSWPQREQFLDCLESILSRVPRRKAYYPGAAERFERFAAQTIDGDGQTLPWTLRRDVNPRDHAHLFEEESFACVLGETALSVPSTEEFLDAAAELANNRLWGTLAANATVPSAYRRTPHGEAHFQKFLGTLRYGTISVNQWAGVAFGLMGSPWGGFPGASLADPHSGIGWVHNISMLDGAEKTVFEGPLFVWPKPSWFPTNRTAHIVARRVLDLYTHPAWWKLPLITLSAARG